jgi:hypothetical protein
MCWRLGPSARTTHVTLRWDREQCIEQSAVRRGACRSGPWWNVRSNISLPNFIHVYVSIDASAGDVVSNINSLPGRLCGAQARQHAVYRVRRLRVVEREPRRIAASGDNIRLRVQGKQNRATFIRTYLKRNSTDIGVVGCRCRRRHECRGKNGSIELEIG